MSEAKKTVVPGTDSQTTNPANNLPEVPVVDATTTKSDRKSGANIVEQSENEEAIIASDEISLIDKISALFPVPTFDREAAFAGAVSKFGTPASFDDFNKINAEISDLEKVWKKDHSDEIKAVEQMSFPKFWEAVCAAGLDAEIKKGITNFTTGLLFSTEKKATIIYHSCQSDTEKKFLVGTCTDQDLNGKTVSNDYYYHYSEEEGVSVYIRSIRALKFYSECQRRTDRDVRKANNNIREGFKSRLLDRLEDIARGNSLTLEEAFYCMRFSPEYAKDLTSNENND